MRFVAGPARVWTPAHGYVDEVADVDLSAPPAPGVMATNPAELAAEFVQAKELDVDWWAPDADVEREQLAVRRSIRQTEAWKNPPLPHDPTSILDADDPWAPA